MRKELKNKGARSQHPPSQMDSQYVNKYTWNNTSSMEDIGDTLVIDNAVYQDPFDEKRSFECTKLLNSLIENNELHISGAAGSKNRLIGDPASGTRKDLVVTYHFGSNASNTIVVDEYEPLNLCFNADSSEHVLPQSEQPRIRLKVFFSNASFDAQELFVVKRWSIPMKWEETIPNFASFAAMMANHFPFGDPSDSSLQYFWEDKAGDMCLLESIEEIRESFSVHVAHSSNVLRFHVLHESKPLEETSNPKRNVNINVKTRQGFGFCPHGRRGRGRGRFGCGGGRKRGALGSGFGRRNHRTPFHCNPALHFKNALGERVNQAATFVAMELKPHAEATPVEGEGSLVVSSDTKLWAHFLQDINIPDGTELSPGVSFIKKWRFQLNGAVVGRMPTEWWSNGQFKGNQRIYARVTGGDTLTEHTLVEAGRINDEGIFDVSVPMQTPEVPGNYTTHFKLETEAGDAFGDNFWLQIRVTEDKYKQGKAKGKPTEAEGQVSVEPNAVPPEGKGKQVEANVACDKAATALSCVGTASSTDASLDEPPMEEQLTKSDSTASSQDSRTSSGNIALAFSGLGSVHSDDRNPMMRDAVQPNATANDDDNIYGEVSEDVSANQAQHEEDDTSSVENSAVLVENPEPELINENAGSIASKKNDSSEDINPFPEAQMDQNPNGQNSPTAAMEGSAIVDLVSKMGDMGFAEAIASAALEGTGGDLEAAVQNCVYLTSPDGWSWMLDEMSEMGFYDEYENRIALLRNGGNLKVATQQLVEAMPSMPNGQ